MGISLQIDDNNFANENANDHMVKKKSAKLNCEAENQFESSAYCHPHLHHKSAIFSLPGQGSAIITT